MKISQRARNVAPFHAMIMSERAATLAADGHDVVRLSLGEPDFGAPPAVSEAMREVMDGRALPYTPALGLPELRLAIAAFYRDRHQVRVDPARIVVTSGASCALLLVSAATVDPGDDVVMADPCYPAHREIVSSFGGRVITIPTRASERYQVSAAGVAGVWTPQASAVLLASPSNPTGTSIPFEELAAVCELARARGAWRVVDEIYLDLSDPGIDGTPPRTVLAVDPDAIVISSFSKYFGMTGWRVGWAVLPEALLPAAQRLATHYFICASAPAQYAALAALTPDSLAVCEQRRLELAARRRLVLAGLADIGLPVPVVPDGAFYVYIDISGTGLDAWTFCERALERAHVALTPGLDFATSTAATHVRLSYAASREVLSEGLRRLGAVVADLEAERAPDGALAAEG